MKRHAILIFLLPLTALMCVVFPAERPVPSATVPPATIASLTLPPTDAPAASQLPVEDATDLPPVTLPASIASPRPAVTFHHPGDSITLNQIKMIDGAQGWAIQDGDVLFTDDGAETWREATPPEVLLPGAQVQAQGAFLDARHAWVVFSFDNQVPPNAVVWHTSDSGHTWIAGASLDHQISGQQVWAEFFALDATHVWLLVRGVYLGAGTHYVAELLRSTDGGLTWSPLSGNETFDYNYDYTGLVFVDANNGLATWQTTGAYAPGPPQYAVTFDGANQWEVHALPPPGDTPNLFETFDYCEAFQPQMFSSQSIRMLMGCFDAYDPPHTFSSYLYSSEDGGSTWQSTRLPEKVPANEDMLFFFDKNKLLLLGKDIYRSADGGQSWDFVKTVSWGGQFSFVDPQTGWAIAHANEQSALVKTSNGGATWIEVKPVIAP